MMEVELIFNDICIVWRDFVREAFLPESAWEALDEYDPSIQKKRSGDFRLIARILDERIGFTSNYGPTFNSAIRDAFKEYDEKKTAWLKQQANSCKDIKGSGNITNHDIDINEKERIVAAMKVMINNYHLNDAIEEKYREKINKIINKRENELEAEVIKHKVEIAQKDEEIAKLKTELKKMDINTKESQKDGFNNSLKTIDIFATVVCPNKDTAKDFWKKYFTDIDRYNVNSVSKGTNKNYRDAYWLTAQKTKLKKKWYIIGTDQDRQISKIFCVEANTYRDEQFGIDWDIKRKWPIKDDQFDACISDINYIEQIKKEVDFSECLYAVADFNMMKIEFFKKNSQGL